MSQSPHLQLAQLENQHYRKKISNADYKRLKWDLIKKIHDQVETVLPLVRDVRPKRVTDSLKSDFCYIPPGPFIYGSDNEYAELKSGIYMAILPVTLKLFKVFLSESNWSYPKEDLEVLEEICPSPNCPVSHVSWLDAKEYCRWLRSKTGEYYSLPNELEWEIAARGIDGRAYPWGYQEPDSTMVCAQCETEFESTVQVGSFASNRSPFGCLDMVGNVWEWCLDSFDDPKDPHALRGGSWIHDVEYATCTSKIFSYPPDKRSDYTGFRIIHLPGDLFEEYSKQTEAENEKPEVELKVVGFASDSGS